MYKAMPDPLSELEQYPQQFPKIAAVQRTKEKFVDLLTESDRLQDLDEEIRDELLLFYVRQSTRLLSECAELKRRILQLERECNNA